MFTQSLFLAHHYCSTIFVLIPASVGLTRNIADWRTLATILRAHGIILITILTTGEWVRVDDIDDGAIQFPLNQGLSHRTEMAKAHHQRHLDKFIARNYNPDNVCYTHIMGLESG